MPDAGAPFEAMPIGDRTFDRSMVEAYARITDDFNPIHVDAAFAAGTEFGRPIVHGTLVVAPLWHHLGAALGAPAAHDVRFQRPTPVGATVSYWTRRDADGQQEYIVRLADGTIVATIVESRKR